MTLEAEWESGPFTIDEGNYVMELTNVEKTSGKFGDSFRWSFKGDHDEHGEFELTGMTSAKLSPASKAGRWVSIMLGGYQGQGGEAIDLEQLIGVEVEVLVRNTEKDDGRTFSNVAEVGKLISDENSFLAQKREKEEDTAEDDIPF